MAKAAPFASPLRLPEAAIAQQVRRASPIMGQNRRHAPSEASSTTARGRPAASLVPRLRRCQLFARGNPSPVCRTSSRCSADGTRDGGEEGRRTEGKISKLIVVELLAQTLSTVPGTSAPPQNDVRLRVPVRRNEVARRTHLCPSATECGQPPESRVKRTCVSPRSGRRANSSMAPANTEPFVPAPRSRRIA
jgi:hypothetical protein